MKSSNDQQLYDRARFPVPRRFWFGIGLAAALTVVSPDIDLAVSGLFFRDGEFFLRHHPLVLAIYHFAPWIVVPFAVGALIAYVVLRVAGRVTWCSLPRRACLFLALVMVLGPGLVVNGVFKDHFGRARPVEILQFGGDRTFSPPLLPADQCRKNCSFSCGHATLGFYFTALSLVLSGRPAAVAFWLAFASGWLIGLARIAQGGHFVSDVLFSCIFINITAWILHDLMFAGGRGVRELNPMRIWSDPTPPALKVEQAHRGGRG